MLMTIPSLEHTPVYRYYLVLHIRDSRNARGNRLGRSIVSNSTAKESRVEPVPMAVIFPCF